ncbi:SDR family NAD(P)-dependent oxidoreductase [Tumebacillus lipolyticus]|uniref:SDR family NAD(P)-dependent oxidoreductase n=1 Tax=Tumebacillus lipolyticus TaxID=1280370 RepID=A0ABW4ZT67_9BACL
MRGNLNVDQVLEMIERRQMTAEDGWCMIKEAQQSPPAEKVYIRPVWEAERLSPQGDDSEWSSSLLIFADSQETLQAWKKRLADRPHDAAFVTWGESFQSDSEGRHFELNPQSPADLQLLIDSLLQRGRLPQRILFHERSRQHGGIEEALHHGVLPLFHLCQALMQQKIEETVRLLYLYEPATDLLGCLRAAIGSFAKTIRLENPRLVVQTMQWQAECEQPALLQAVQDEWSAGGQHAAEIRYVDGIRQVKRLAEHPVGKQQTDRLPLRKHGVYLITGGAGGLGLLFAEYLAREWQARLVLTGRSELGAERAARLKALESFGAEVLYLEADVACQDAVIEVVKSAKQRFGALHGIVHSAGVTRDSFLLKKTEQEFQEVLAPKVCGALHLEAATADEPLDFFALFSSTAALTGNVGQADYAFANSFLDHFAELRAAHRSGRTISYNWPYWADGGMRAEAELLAELQRRLGIAPLSTQAGIEGFVDGLQAGVSQLAVLAGDAERIRRSLTGEDELAGGAATEAFEVDSGEQAELASRMEAYLKDLFAAETKVPAAKIRAEEPLEKYGIDSLVIMGLTRELEREFGDLSKTLFFEYQTIEELSAYFLKRHLGSVQAKFGLTVRSKAERATLPPVEQVEQVERVEQKGALRKRFLQPLDTNAHRGNDDQSAVALATDEIAIIGLSGRYPQARTLDQFWENLRSGRDCITEVPAERWDHRDYFDPDKGRKGKTYSKWGGFLDDVDKFDSLFFNISPREADVIDPQERLFLETVWHTFEDAGYTRSSLNERSVGVFVGVMWGQYQLHQTEVDGNLITPGSSYASIANRVSYTFNLHGPSLALDTMCSSSLTAIHLACDSLRKGESKLAVAGGVNLTIHPNKYLQLAQGKFASSDGRCRAFGDGGDGYVPGEGVGAVLLKPLAQAKADGDRIYAVIKATAVNHGGKTNGYTVPNPNAQGELIAEVLKRANLDPQTISYIEAHGTGTSLGDPIEITGLRKAFGEEQERQYCAIGSVKSNIGHLESAAGIAGLTKVLLQMKHGQLVPSLHAKPENPHIPFAETPFYVQRELSEWKRLKRAESGREVEVPRRAGISSFGAGGSNAHLIVEEYLQERQVDVEAERGPHLLVLSAKREEQLLESAERLREFLSSAERPAVRLSDVAYTLQVGREPMGVRLAIIAETVEDAVHKLTDLLARKAGGDGVHLGEVADQPIALGDDQEDRDYLEAMVRRGNLDKVASFWVKGMSIDWQLFDRGNDPTRISLPGYPFARERHWVQSSGTKPDLLRRASEHASGFGPLHPLVDRNESTLQEEVFRKTLRKEEFFLHDHVVAGKHVLPGVAYLEMARAAGELAGSGRVQELQEIVWASPVVLETEEQDVWIRLQPDREAVEFEVFSRANDKRALHAKGRLLMAEQASTAGRSHPAKFDLSAIKSRCSTRMSQQTVYGAFRTMGFEYGSSFCVTQEVHCGEREALGLLHLPSELREEASAYSLHPSLLDAAVRVAFGIGGDGYQDPVLRIPFALGKVEIFQPLPSSCYAYAFAAEDRLVKEDQVQTCNIAILNEQGEVLALLTDFSSHPVRERALGKTGGEQLYYYRPEWELSPLPNRPLHDGIERLEALVLFEQEEAFTQQMQVLLGTLSGRQKRIVRIRQGDRYQQLAPDLYTVRTAVADDYQQLIEALDEQGVRLSHIVHLWNGSNEGAASEAELTLQEQLDRGLYSVLRLFQTLTKRKRDEQTDCLFLFAGGPSAIAPHHEMLSGFAKSLTSVNHRFQLILLQMEAQASTLQQQVKSVVSELAFAEYRNGTEIRYVGEERQIRRLHQQPVTTQASADQHPLLKTKGVYLITGGLGGLGMIFADYLAKNYQARLVLTGRSALSAEKRLQVEALEGRGAEVLYCQADVSRAQEVQEMLSAARDRYGKIDGIFHSAGVGSDLPVLQADREAFAEVLSPKLEGTLHLDRATTEEQLDFFILFSSSSALIGDFGECSYATGNAFQDRFAAWREQQRLQGARTGRTISINWPLWKSGGLDLPEETDAFFSFSGMRPLETEMGLRAFEESLRMELPQVVVMSGEVEKINRVLRVEQQRVEKSDRPAEVIGVAASTTSTEGLFEATEAYLKEMLAKTIQFPAQRINTKIPLEEYGIDSVMIMEMNSLLEKDIADLPKTLLFEHRTLHQLSNYLVQHHEQAIRPVVGWVEPLASSAEAEAHHATAQVAVAEEILPARRFFETQAPTVSSAPSPTSTATQASGQEEIAIIGVSGRYPMAQDLEQFWENLKQGLDCITEIPQDRWDHRRYFDPQKGKKGKIYSKWGGFLEGFDSFDPLFFNMSPREAESIDPQERQFLEVVWETIEDAGYTRTSLQPHRVGVFVGAMYGQYELFGIEESMRGNVLALSSFFSSIANRVSYLMNFNGPSLAVDTLCSSSLESIRLACQNIWSGACDMAVAGGVNLSLHPNKYIFLCQSNFLSSDGRCRSFGAGGDGYVPGEGVGAVLLKRLSQAVADGDQIYAVIKGTAVNHGGKTNGYTVPNPTAQAELIAEAFRAADVDARTISYIEAHGTGTPLGDPIEITGLQKAFAETTQDKQFCAIGSAKSNIGHLESAAGIAGVTKVLLQMKHKQLVPSLHSDVLNPNLNISATPFYLQHQLSEWKRPVIERGGREQIVPRRAGVSAFGAGGTNVHLVLEEYEAPQSGSESTDSPQLIVLSARTEERLKAYAQKLLNTLQKRTAVSKTIYRQVEASLEKRVQADLIRLAAEVLEVGESNLDLAAAQEEYGFDRLAWHQLLQRVNEAYGLDLSSADVPQSTSLLSFAHFLLQSYREALLSVYPAAVEERVVEQKSQIRLLDVAYTLQVGREAMKERVAVVASSVAELIEKLQAYCQEQQHVGEVYRGTVRSGREDVELLVDGAEGELFLNSLIQNRKFQKLASLWVSGVEIDWSLLYTKSAQVPRRITLATYPFAKQRYWIPDVDKRDQKRSAESVRPLLDGVDLQRSLRQGLVFRKALHRAHPLWRLDAPTGQLRLSFTAWLEMAAEAGLELAENSAFSIHQLTGQDALELTGGQAELSLSLQEQQGRYRLEIESGQPQRTRHAQGDLIVRAAGEAPHFAVQDCIARSHQESVRAGLLHQVWQTQEEILAAYSLSPAQGQEGYALPPDLLDAVWELAGEMGICGEPDGVQQLDWHIPVPETGYVYLKRAGQHQFHVALIDEQGQVSAKLQAVSVPAVQLEDRLDPFFCLPTWVKSPLAALPTAPAKRRAVLIVAPPESLGLDSALTEAHRRAGDQVRTILLGQQTVSRSETVFEIDVEAETALAACFEQIDSLDLIYFLGGLQAQKYQIDDRKELERSQLYGSRTLFRLMKALVDGRYAERGVELKVITNDVHQVLSDEQSLPFAAGLNGFIRTMPKEYPQLKVACVDISLTGQESLQDVTGHLLSEPAQTHAEELAWRHGERYRLQLVPTSLPPLAKEHRLFRKQGVYLILGGLGSVGLDLAAHLAETEQARLVLVGRSELTRTKREQIAQIESRGAQVLYVRADLADLQDMRAVIAKAKQRFGALHGVFHSAMAFTPTLFEDLDEAQFERSLAPKVQGSLFLYEVLKDERLDFLVFFSSGQSFTGNAERSHYAASCNFEDAYVLRLQQELSYPVRLINWGFWGTIGGKPFAPEELQYLEAQGIIPIPPTDGMEAVRRVLSHRVSQVLGIKVKEFVLNLMGVDRDYRIELYPENGSSVFHSLGGELNPQPVLAGRAEATNYCRQLLLDTFQRMGVFKRAGEAYERAALRDQLGVVPKYFRLYEELLDMLAEQGWLTALDSRVQAADSVEQEGTNLQLRGEELMRRYPEMGAYLRLVIACIADFPEILRGELAATDVIFPNSSMELVEGIYKGNESADYYNQLVVDRVRTYLESRLPQLEPGEKIRLLEIGAGTGGTSARVLQALKRYADRVEYVYTDVSKAFTMFGREQYGAEFPFVRFQVLDIERDVRGQGVDIGTFDLVIAANVLHATKRLQETVRHAKALLRTNGWLVLNEGTEVLDVLTLTFGLLDGWWLFEDEEIRLKGSPLLSADMWKRLLQVEGYDRVQAVGNVIIGESNGRVKVKKDAPAPQLKDAPAALIEQRIEPTPPPVAKHQPTLDQGEQMQEQIADSVSSVLKIDRQELDIDTPLMDMGVDSILAIKIVDEIKGRLGTEISANDLFDHSTIRELSAYLAGKAPLAPERTVEPIADSSAAKRADRELFIDTPAQAFPQDRAAAVTEVDEVEEVLRRLEQGEIDVEEVDRLLEELL